MAKGHMQYVPTDSLAKIPHKPELAKRDNPQAPYLVPQAMTPAIFPSVAGYLAKAVNLNHASEWTVDALGQACANGHVLLFVDDIANPKHALTLQFRNWGGVPTCYIMFLGGEGGSYDWIARLPYIRAFAEAHGVRRITANLRMGLWRRLRSVFRIKPLAILCEIEV
jgi:hypothetical protein